MNMNKWMQGIAIITISCVAGGMASAGTYANISIDGSFGDWAGVPVLVNDASGDGNPIDVATVQLANDENNLYVRLTYHTAVNPNAGPVIYLAFDTDNNVATGYDIYGTGQVGSEAGWSNDFPFDQRGGFNSGVINGGGALISPYNASTTEQEYSISRAATYQTGGSLVFGNDSFTLLAWTDSGVAADTAGTASYTFAPVPEPTASALIGLAGLAMLRRRTA